MVEIWKDIVGYEGWYSVSNLGRVRREKDSNKTYVGKILKGICVSHEYYRVYLCKNGVQKGKRIHLLVAETFIGPRPEGLQCNHKDGNKINNCISNLEYVTPRENALHSHRTGLQKSLCGSSNPKAKLTEKQVIKIREKYKEGCMQSAIAQKYNVTRQLIWRIVYRKVWKHI